MTGYQQFVGVDDFYWMTDCCIETLIEGHPVTVIEDDCETITFWSNGTMTKGHFEPLPEWGRR
jgi:hypothetical protein